MEDQKHIWAPFFFLKNPECSCQYIKSNLGCNLKKIKNMVDLLFFLSGGCPSYLMHWILLVKRFFLFTAPPAAEVGTAWIDQFLKELGPIRFRWFFKVYLKYYLYISSSHFHSHHCLLCYSWQYIISLIAAGIRKLFGCKNQCHFALSHLCAHYP